MKVKLYRGASQPKYLLHLAADADISELPDDAKAAIEAVGDLTLIREEDLSEKSDEFSNEIKKNIKDKGAFFSRLEVRFEEVQCGPPK